MSTGARPFVVLLVLLLSSLSNAVGFEVETEEDVLEKAASNWHAFEPVSVDSSPLKTVDTRIHLAVGSFDPLVDDMPKSRLTDSNDYRHTGMAIVQMNHHVGADLYDLVEKYNLFILDNLGGSAWLVRLAHPSDLDAVASDDLVRWAGVMHPGWRISPDVDSSTVKIAAIPSADLIPEALEGLAHDLVMMGADEAWCGLHLCEISGPIDLGQLAKDGRIIWSESGYDLELTNAMAGATIGVPSITNSSLTLDGSGEIISFTDTGLDQDHPDVLGRVAGVYTQFGLDPSPADSNSGHGTHVAITIAGDGTGNATATGIAPEAYIIAYALEHDPTGVFGRLGSIYDMLRHAEQEGSRVSVNAWGLNGNRGAYTADSRSVDVFVDDNPEFLPIFSAGDDVAQDPSKVQAPSTAKNVLSIGASTTSLDTLANFSANGPTLDGRVKPDLVAPGVGICSGRAEEARIPSGWSCGTETHSNGDDMYMSLDGSSQATAVAGGSVSLIREFIREEIGISSPSASLLKAAAINGAVDLGSPDIPNAQEGWGRISVENSIIPTYQGTELQTYHDNSRQISAGFSALYAFDLDPSSGLDVTLAWTDIAGSANAAQNESRLVNDLDLVLLSPDGTVYKGNVFNNGFSIPNGVHDSVNNVERIRIAPSSSLPSGQWQISVVHAGGMDQAFSLVVTGDANLVPVADLTTFAGSIYSSSASPLVNDLITLRISWINQGTVASGNYRVTFEDLTSGETLYDGTRSSLSPGLMDSLTIYHSFTTTGDHDLRLSVDVDSDVIEMNDENDGTDNNIWDQTINVAALGVRLLPLDANGAEDIEQRNQTLDPSTAEGYTWPILLKHEGTATQEVKIYISQVQTPHPTRDDMLLPTDDDWSRYSDLSGPFTLSPMDQTGDSIHLNVTMNDDDADLSGQTPRYAMAGTYVMDITARYNNDPSVKHSIRLKLVVEEVKDVQVAPAGTTGLEAVPGGSTGFSISVRNTGNSPALYDLSCFSENRWQVELGQSNSSSYAFEPLDILEYLPMQVRLYVPPVVDGLPAAGSTDSITCSVTSAADPDLNISETVTLTVATLESFETVLRDDLGFDVGPAAYARDINVDTGERLNITLDIENTGNAELDLSVRVSPELTTWTIQVNHGSQTENREVDVAILPGESAQVRIEVLVSPTAARNDANKLVIKTSQDQSNFIVNETTLVVKDELGALIETYGDAILNAKVNRDFTYNMFSITNTGNSAISLDWDMSLPPDGWEVGFDNPVSTLNPRLGSNVTILVKAPDNTVATTSAFELGVYVTISNGIDELEITQTFTVQVESMSACLIETDEDAKPLFGVPRDGSASQMFTVTNVGNQPLDAPLSASMEADYWTVSLSEDTISGLVPGESLDIELTVSAEDDTETGIQAVIFSCGEEEIEVEASVESRKDQGGLFGILPVWAASAILVAMILVGVVVVLKLKNSAPKDYSGEELVAPDAHSIPDDGARMQAMMDSVVGEESMASGSVSAEEIAEALAQSIPALPPPAPVVPAGRPPSAAVPAGRPPTAAVPAGRPPAVVPQGRPPAPAPQPSPQVPMGPPIPPGGIPPGWTMEQWQHYGQQWLEQQGQQ